jgi:hypothetical protein
VENGVIGWMVISQKRLNFWMKRDCKVQDNMGGNGLGNRCSILLSYGTMPEKRGFVNPSNLLGSV